MTELTLKQSSNHYHPVLPIKTEKDYEKALAEIEILMETAAPGSYEEDRMDVLATLVEAYEAEHYPIGLPHPIAAIEYYLESRGLSRTEFCELLGISNGRLAELLNKRRALSTNLIRKIEEVTEIPATVLIQPYELEKYQA